MKYLICAYIIGIIIAFCSMIGMRIKKGKVTLADLILSVLFCLFSWASVVSLIGLDLIDKFFDLLDKLDNFVIWQKKIKSGDKK